MSSGEAAAGGWDVEALLTDALRPIEPPERLSGRIEDTFAAITQTAAEDWVAGLRRAERARQAA